MTSQTRNRSRTCTHHCSACGRHFHSLKAFDAHRLGEHDDKRFCESPEAVEDRHGRRRLQLYTDAGLCRLGPDDLIAVEVWQTVPSVDLNSVFGRAA